MDGGEAAIAAVFGSLTGSEAAPMLFEALLPWVTYPDAKSEKSRRNAKLLEQLASAVAKNIPRTSLTRARGLLAETIRNAQTNGRAEAQASSMRSKHRYSGRRQVEKESRFSAAGRVRTVAPSYWRYHDFPHHWPGAEHRNDRAAAKAPTFESDGRALAGVGGELIASITLPSSGMVAGLAARTAAASSAFSVCPAHRVATERP